MEDAAQHRRQAARTKPAYLDEVVDQLIAEQEAVE